MLECAFYEQITMILYNLLFICWHSIATHICIKKHHFMSIELNSNISTSLEACNDVADNKQYRKVNVRIKEVTILFEN